MNEIRKFLQQCPQMNKDQIKAVLLPGMNVQAASALAGLALPDMSVTDNNQLGQRANTIWKSVASKGIAVHSHKVAPMSALATDFSAEPIEVRPGVHTRISVPLVYGTGGALRGVSNWNRTQAKVEYVDCELTRISRPFGMTETDLMHGESIEGLLEAAIGEVVDDVLNLYVESLSAWVAENKVQVINVALATFGPQWVAETLSPALGVVGSIENLVLTASASAKLIPHNAQMLALTPGVYGIGNFHTSAGIEHAHHMSAASTPVTIPWTATVDPNTNVVTHAAGTGTAFGIATQKRAAIFVARPPRITGNALSVRELGAVAGVPLMLKSWEEPSTEYIMNSVETMAGFTLTMGAAMRVLSTAAANIAAA